MCAIRIFDRKRSAESVEIPDSYPTNSNSTLRCGSMAKPLKTGATGVVPNWKPYQLYISIGKDAMFGVFWGKMIFGEQTISQIIVAADGVAQKKPRVRAF
jgi:hypothetical protein